MDDELEDKIFYQTYVSHMKILSKFAIGLPPINASCSYVYRLFRAYLTRPEVLICGFLLFLLMLYLQAAEVWTRGFVGRIQSTLGGLRPGGKKLDLMSPMSSPAEKHSWEVKGDVSAVYSVKGRRPNMEDR